MEVDTIVFDDLLGAIFNRKFTSYDDRLWIINRLTAFVYKLRGGSATMLEKCPATPHVALPPPVRNFMRKKEEGDLERAIDDQLLGYDNGYGLNGKKRVLAILKRKFSPKKCYRGRSYDNWLDLVKAMALDDHFEPFTYLGETKVSQKYFLRYNVPFKDSANADAASRGMTTNTIPCSKTVYNFAEHCKSLGRKQ